MIISQLYIIKMPVRLALCCLLWLLSFSAIAARAEDSEQPVNIKADQANFEHDDGVAVYTGHVSVDQGSRHLLSDTLTIKRDKNNKIKVIIAVGRPASFKSQANSNKAISHGRANIIKYYPQQDKVDLLDNAELTQNGDTVQGPILNYDFVTGNLQSLSSIDQRTTFILQPKRQ